MKFEINKIYNEDCIKYMKTLPNECVDLIIADPPYYKSVKNEWDNIWKTDIEYIEWCKLWIIECVRILKPKGNIVIWGQLGEKQIAYARLLVMLEDEINELTRKNIVTVKRNKGQGTSTNFMSNREEFIWLSKAKKGYTFNKQYTTELKNNYGYKGNKDKPNFKVAGNVWDDIVFPWFGSKTEPYINTAQKPLLACDRIINALSNENDLVYIPFAGSGSEIVSCIKTNRNYIATELNNHYIEEIIKPRIGKCKK